MNAFEWLLLVLYKMLKKQLWNSFFTVSGGWNSATCTWSRQFPIGVLFKRGILKNFSKSSDKDKKQSSGGFLWKDILKNFAKFTEKHLESLFGGVSFLIKLQAENLKLSEADAGVSKTRFPKNFANFTGKNLWWSLFLMKLEFWGPATLLKKVSDTGASLWNFQTF